MCPVVGVSSPSGDRTGLAPHSARGRCLRLSPPLLFRGHEHRVMQSTADPPESPFFSEQDERVET